MITPEDRNGLIESLVELALATNGGFKLVPPDEVNAQPSILNLDNVVDVLQFSEWRLVFSDGQDVPVAFGEMLMFLQAFDDVRQMIQRLTSEELSRPGALSISISVNVNDVMTRDLVRRLLRGLTAVGKEG